MTTSPSPKEAFNDVSDEVMKYVYTIVMGVMGTALCIFGIGSNIVNVIVFTHMKFNDTINIALLGLSISDMCALVCSMWVNISLMPAFRYSSLPVMAVEISHKTGGWTHFVFIRVTTFITMYITLERCLCIAFPLKIKQMLTPKRVWIIIISIYVVTLGTLSANHATYRLGWKFEPEMNRSMIGLIFNSKRDTIQTISYYITVTFVGIPFTGVIVCSSILIWKIKERRRWLQSATQANAGGVGKSGGAATGSNKDAQVINMVVVVAVIFIVSYTPAVCFFLATALEPELNVLRGYENTFFVIKFICFTANAISAGANIFVYYNMSSKFKATFDSLFARCCLKKSQMKIINSNSDTSTTSK